MNRLRPWIRPIRLGSGWISLSALLLILSSWREAGALTDVETDTGGCMEISQEGDRVDFEFFHVSGHGKRQLCLKSR